MEEAQYLTQFGLSEREATAYLTLLGTDKMSILDISKKTGIHRPALYEILPKLEAKQLVRNVRVGKREYYAAESPKKIEKLFAQVQSGFQTFIDRLNQEYTQLDKRPVAQLHYGKKGYDYLFDDIASVLPKEGIYYRYSARRTDEKHFNPTDYYFKMRDKKRFERKVITSAAKHKNKGKRLEREIKSIPENVDLFDDNVSSYIYADRIAFVDHDTQTTFIVHSKKISDFQKKLFQMLWGKL